MFILFNGEAYDYIGSSRVAYDMLDGNFPNNLIKLNQSHVGLFVELSQIHYDKEVVFYRPIKNNVCIYNLICIKFKKNIFLICYCFILGY